MNVIYPSIDLMLTLCGALDDMKRRYSNSQGYYSKWKENLQKNSNQDL